MKDEDMPTFGTLFLLKIATFEMVFLRKLLGMWLEKMQCWSVGNSRPFPGNNCLFLYWFCYQGYRYAYIIICEMCSLHNLSENVMTCFFFYDEENMWVVPSSHVCLIFFNSKEQVSHLWYLKALSFISPRFIFFSYHTSFCFSIMFHSDFFFFPILLIFFSFNPLIDLQTFSKVNHLKYKTSWQQRQHF